MIFVNWTALRQHFAQRAIEWWLAVVMVAWGYYLVMVDGVFATNPNFAALRQLGPQIVWASVAVAAGLARLIVLYVNGQWRRSPHFRLGASFVSAFIWTQVAIGCFVSEPGTPSSVIYAGLALADVYSALRAGTDAGRSDKIHRETEAENDGRNTAR